MCISCDDKVNKYTRKEKTFMNISLLNIHKGYNLKVIVTKRHKKVTICKLYFLNKSSSNASSYCYTTV